ncbi:TonB-dependent siderophore receptor [Thiomicrorhabdus sp. Milos-T2]|uniref:TonB-dependent receptor plug domain-containing protein n=1 Tax=Thiomicrorhabdus sp. Milos-T2 TaxID=90814 RepID=UPI000493DEBD|nr:TonB-dependent receptor [Thiomicrorhabdus sp. Milos-T2]
MKLSKISAAILVATISQNVFAETTNLDKIVVTANNMSQNIQSITSQINVITREEIKEKQYQTLQQALQQVPGVNLYNNGGPLQATSIQMRGSSSGQVLVMVDGIAINDPSGFGANLNSVALQDIERIEILKGPQAGVWGANAAAGVINIITTQAKSGEQGQVNIELGSNNTKKLVAGLSAANEQGDFAFSISNINSDGFSTIMPVNGDASDGENDGYSQTDFSLKLGVNLNKHHRLETFIKKGTTNTDFDSGFPIDTNDTLSNSDMNSTLRKLQYIYNQDRFNLRIYLSKFEIDRTVTDPFSTAYYKGDITEKGAVANYEYLKNQTFAAGLTQTITNGLSDYYGVSTSEYQSTGLFVSNTNHFNNGSLILTESIRKDNYDNNFDDKLTGKIGFKNYFTPDVYLSGQYGTAYNAPSLYQYTHPVPGFNLQPETTEGYEVNLGVYGLQLSYYNNEISDLYSYDSTSFGYYNESGKSNLKGMEISYSHYFNTLDTELYLSYETLSAKDSNNKWLGRRPESQANLNVSYDGFKNTVLGIETRYIGQMNDRNEANGQSAQIGDYFTTNLTASYRINKNLAIYGRVVNAFNENYTNAVANYSSTYDTSSPVQDIYNNGGRQFFIGVQSSL